MDGDRCNVIQDEWVPPPDEAPAGEGGASKEA